LRKNHDFFLKSQRNRAKQRGSRLRDFSGFWQEFKWMAQRAALAEDRFPATENVTEFAPRGEAESDRKDYFVHRDGLEYAGAHVLADLWGASRLNDIAHIEASLREIVETCGATLLHIHLHHFSENGGVSGVAVLAESHITVHTWPERDFAAFDIFMCGACDPNKAVPVLRRYFEPESIQAGEHKRGIVG
jgi:S-adenosylmethionine decarboxylase